MLIGYDTDRATATLAVTESSDWMELAADLTYMHDKPLRHVCFDFSAVRGAQANSPYAPYDVATFLQQVLFVFELAGGNLWPYQCQVSVTLPYQHTAAGMTILNTGLWATMRGTGLYLTRPNTNEQQWYPRWCLPIKRRPFTNHICNPLYPQAVPLTVHLVLRAMARLADDGCAAVSWRPDSEWWEVSVLATHWRLRPQPEPSALEWLTQCLEQRPHTYRRLARLIQGAMGTLQLTLDNATVTAACDGTLTTDEGHDNVPQLLRLGMQLTARMLAPGFSPSPPEPLERDVIWQINFANLLEFDTCR